MLDGTRHVNLSANDRQILFSAEILAVQSLLQLPTDAFCKDRGKEVVKVFKFLCFHIFVAALIQRSERVGQHVVNVSDEDALILRH